MQNFLRSRPLKRIGAEVQSRPSDIECHQIGSPRVDCNDGRDPDAGPGRDFERPKSGGPSR
ncbi:Hypothetical predicted protein, partial [Olea europaea subsp. europaea]